MAERHCEFSDFGPVCGASAAWIVAVGSRKSDAQRSCRRHLSRTCDVMRAAENRAGVVLTVTPVEQWDSQFSEFVTVMAGVLDELDAGDANG